jgi:hypothetical protein
MTDKSEKGGATGGETPEGQADEHQADAISQPASIDPVGPPPTEPTTGEGQPGSGTQPGPGDGPGKGNVGRTWIVLISLLLLMLSGLVLVTLVQLWPASVGSSSSFLTNHVVLGMRAELSLDTNLMLVVALSGALGGLLHSLRSIAWYVGERELKWSWILFYACLPFVASILALLFYFVLRGGLISGSDTSKDLSPYGIAAIAGLVGLFSNQAAEMLKNVFSSLFAKAPQGSDTAPQKSNGEPAGST